MFSSRRGFLIGSFLAGLGMPFRRLFGQTNVLDETAFQEGLKLWVECLLPADDYSPGAGGLGVHLELIEEARGRPEELKFLRRGIRWANQSANVYGAPSFAELEPERAEDLIRFAESKEAGEGPYLFFRRTLSRAKRLYYAREESWGGLPMDRAPQPFGYMKYSKSPEE